MVKVIEQSFKKHRATTLSLIESLSAEDMVIQSMEDASPTKWHLAHTTWFFEEFVLRSFQENFKEIDPDFRYLFNSYYETVGKRHQRPLRGMLTRPGLEKVLDYRQQIDNAILTLLGENHPKMESIANTITVGLHHEMQHQELLLTDILHAFSVNPIFPAVRPSSSENAANSFARGHSSKLEFFKFDEGLYNIGANETGFFYDCEGPQHQTYIQQFGLANRLVSNREWCEFIEDGGYRIPTLWLSEGWARVQTESWQHPLYWIEKNGEWFQFGLNGLTPLDPDAPVSHVSYFEADAFARWSDYRLPTEQEWELAAKQHPIEGNFLDSNLWQPTPAINGDRLEQLYGDVWEWTRSPYAPYPGYKALDGAIGEYNGKFMCGQFVLRGGSCVTPQQQLRPSYRNFFYPHQRWQFSGLRLAKDI